MSRLKTNIGLFGFGEVGQAFHDVLQQTPDAPALIRSIVVRRKDKPRKPVSLPITTDPEYILNDPSIDLVVEATDDADAAFSIVCRALRAGKAVVSANKKMLASHLGELQALQKETGGVLLYEAAACASIPIIRNLEAYFEQEALLRIEGIVNGSTNYILSRMQDEGLSFDEALKQAQSLGYAESDPSLDTHGWDAAYKLCILALHAFGLELCAGDVLRLGIEQLNPAAVQFARDKGWQIKLLASATVCDGQLRPFVLPAFVRSDHPLHQTDGVLNGVCLQTAFAEAQFYRGRGAGGKATASALLADVLAWQRGFRYAYPKRQAAARPKVASDFPLRIHLAVSSGEELPVHAFDSVEVLHREGERGWLLGTIGSARLQTEPWFGDPRYGLVLMPAQALQQQAPDGEQEPEAVSGFGTGVSAGMPYLCAV